MPEIDNISDILTNPIKIGVDSYMKTKFFCVPGIVQDFDPDTQNATVKIAILKHDANSDSFTEHPIIINCPVGFSGDTVIFGHEITQGCEGLIHFSQRAVANWQNTGGIVEPDTMRKFSMQDAFFAPAYRSDPNVIQGFKNNGAWMMTKNGTNFIHLKNDGSAEINVNQLDITTTVTNWTTTSLNVTGDVVVDGNISATQTVGAPTVTATSSLAVAGTEMKSHTHGGVDRGTSNTDPV